MISSNFTPLKTDNKKQGSSYVSSTFKESEPFYNEGDLPEKLVIHEAQEYNLDEKTIGFVEKKHKSISITEDLKKIGVIPINSNGEALDFKKIQLPISDDKIVSGLKQPVTSSFRWLAEFALYLLKKAHTTLKIIHGKITRIAMAQ